MVDAADIFIFGSLCARHAASAITLSQLLDTDTYKVFDINLRPPHYNLEQVVMLMTKADFIKCNDEELIELSSYFNIGHLSFEAQMSWLANNTATDEICVTKGKDGAVLLQSGIFFYSKGFEVRVKDTVGAGDSFLSAFIHMSIQGKAPQFALDYASAVGALVAQEAGANPIITESQINDLMHQQK